VTSVAEHTASVDEPAADSLVGKAPPSPAGPLEADDLAPERALHRNVTMILARGGRVILRARHG
jgi:hypothetical protein